MRQNGNKIWHIKYKRSLKLAAAMLAVSLAFPMAAQAKAWDFENGSYVDASGTPIEGAVAKGITVTKYQNRANRENGIDWGKVAADGVGFAMIRIGYYGSSSSWYKNRCFLLYTGVGCTDGSRRSRICAPGYQGFSGILSGCL